MYRHQCLSVSILKLETEDDRRRSVELAWCDFKQYLGNCLPDEQPVVQCYSIQHKYSDGDCHPDDSYFVVTRDGDEVCTVCGEVKKDRLQQLENLYNNRPRPNTLQAARAVYQAAFHLHERIAQLCLKDPPIPKEYWIYIETAWNTCRRGAYSEQFTRSEVGRLLRSITGDLIEDVEPGLFIYRKFHERWISIRFILSGGRLRPPKISAKVLWDIEIRFMTVLHHWNTVRHSEECDKLHGKHKVRTDCHQSLGCRHNLPNYNFMLRQFLLDIAYRRPCEKYMVQELLGYLKKVKTSQRKTRLQQFWLRLCPLTNIPLYKD